MAPRIAVCLLFIAVTGLEAAAQDDSRGWTFYGNLQGSSNSSGIILKADPGLAYRHNRYFQTYGGLPIYFVDKSSTLTPPGGPNVVNGIGNAYLGLALSVDNDVVNYGSDLVFSVPTGDKDRGFSTGRVTVDWTNRFDRTFSFVTPFANVGVANTVSDTAFFVRPFSSLGLVSHFEGGARAEITPVMSIGASAYAVRASGEQRILSKIIERGRGSSTGRRRVFETAGETVGPAEVANDHGFSSWFVVAPRSAVDFHVGYNRSIEYEFNSLFFGVGFRVGK
jgi:hypothetical protein